MTKEGTLPLQKKKKKRTRETKLGEISNALFLGGEQGHTCLSLSKAAPHWQLEGNVLGAEQSSRSLAALIITNSELLAQLI